MRKLLTALLLVPLAASAAQAHAFLDRSTPAVGRDVPTVPTQVTIWFTQELEPAFSSIEVHASGQLVDAGNAQVDPKDASILHVALKSLPYPVRPWCVPFILS